MWGLCALRYSILEGDEKRKQTALTLSLVFIQDASRLTVKRLSPRKSRTFRTIKIPNFVIFVSFVVHNPNRT